MPTANDPLAALRGATAPQHAILDSGLPLAQADATLQDYFDHLLMLLRAWLAPIEAWLASTTDRGGAAAPSPHRLNYLKGDADGPGPRWRAFSAAPRAQLRGNQQIAQACAGAGAGAGDAFARLLALRSMCR